MAEFINTIDVLGDDAVIDSIIDRTITEFKDNSVTTLGSHAFYGCTALKTVDIPNVRTLNKIAYATFRGCSSLERIELWADIIPNETFNSCSALQVGIFPCATSINYIAFQNCKALRLVDFHSLTALNHNPYFNFASLKHFAIRTGSVCSLAASGNFGSETLLYVPSALLDSYKGATNWSDHADRILPLESYTVDGTVTGAFDETKI